MEQEIPTGINYIYNIHGKLVDKNEKSVDEYPILDRVLTEKDVFVFRGKEVELPSLQVGNVFKYTRYTNSDDVTSYVVTKVFLSKTGENKGKPNRVSCSRIISFTEKYVRYIPGNSEFKLFYNKKVKGWAEDAKDDNFVVHDDIKQRIYKFVMQ